MNSSTRSPGARAKRHEGGFAILEALIALLVVAFGMLAIAAFQFTLSRASDIAKQRTEATRIAEREIDRVRSFVARGADGNTSDARLTYTEDLAVGTVNLANVTGAMTNTTFRPQRIVSQPTAPVPVGGEPYRWVNVIVRWDDRTGVEQSINLSTAISDGVPGDLGSLAGGVGIATTLRPKNRNINIPYPAVNLAGGATSAFMPPPGNAIFTFNNVNGRVLQRCTGVGSLSEGMDLSTTPGVTCTSYAVPGYLMSGYVRFKTQGAAASASNIDDPNDLTDDTRPLVDTDLSATPPVQPITITSSATSHAPDSYECYAQRQLTVRRNSPPPGEPSDITIAEGATIPTGYSASGAPRFIAFTCVVIPIDHDSNPATDPIWSGEVTLNPLVWTFGTSGNLGATTGTGRLCRFSSDYNRNLTLSNSEHPRYFRQVSGTLDNQNFLVVNGGDNCPTDVASDPPGGNYIDTNTAQHQTGPVLSFRCLNASCSGANRINMETTPSNPAAAIPME